jgi:LEA14-like dessication related protein
MAAVENLLNLKRWRRAALSAVAVALVGCGLTPKFEQPQIDIVDVQVLKSDLLHQELRVRLKVQNPNNRALAVKGITYEMEVAGDAFAHGQTEQGFEVPALGSAEFDVSMSANAAGTVLRLLSSGKRLEQVDYRLVGKVALARGVLRSIPFDQKGEFKLR